jgi:hypothetical protein
MNRPINPAAAEHELIRRVHDRVDLKSRDVAVMDLQTRPVHHGPVHQRTFRSELPSTVPSISPHYISTHVPGLPPTVQRRNLPVVEFTMTMFLTAGEGSLPAGYSGKASGVARSSATPARASAVVPIA